MQQNMPCIFPIKRSCRTNYRFTIIYVPFQPNSSAQMKTFPPPSPSATPLMVHTGKIFSTLPQVEENPMVHVSSSRQQQFFNALPEENTFTRQTYLLIAETLGILLPSSDRYINRLVSCGMIEKVGHGEFRRGYLNKAL